jgi:transposase
VKAGIAKACFYEPMVNRTYADLARHYGTAIVPARPYKPRDKAKVEVGVQVVGRWILARLRHRHRVDLKGPSLRRHLVTGHWHGKGMKTRRRGRQRRESDTEHPLGPWLREQYV